MTTTYYFPGPSDDCEHCGVIVSPDSDVVDTPSGGMVHRACEDASNRCGHLSGVIFGVACTMCKASTVTKTI